MASSPSNLDEKARIERQRRSAPSPPRRPLRERLLPALPAYSGPHSVGMMDLELPAREPRAVTLAGGREVDALAPRLETVLFAIYYPCDPGARANANTSGAGPPRPAWLPRPRLRACKGYAGFLNLSRLPAAAYIAATTMFTKLPAFRNAKPLAASRVGGDGQGAPSGPGKGEAMSDQDGPAFPVVVFSHGLGGSRTCYSSVCGELASNGLIVVALEHRDKPEARSFANKPPRRHCADAKDMTSARPASHRQVDRMPKDDAQGSKRLKSKGADGGLCSAPTEMRMAEIEEVFFALDLINQGRGDMVAKSNLRKKANIGPSSRGPGGIDWSEWTGSMRLDHVTMMGHGSGGATSMQALRRPDRFPWVGQGVLLDSTWAPVTPGVGQGTDERFEKSLLAISSETSMQRKGNFDPMVAACKEANDGGCSCWMMTIRGSTHLSQTDFGVIFPSWMSPFGKSLANSTRAIHTTVSSSLEFLGKVLPASHTAQKRWVDEGILEGDSIPVSPPLPTEQRRPKLNAWVDRCLRFPSGFRARISKWFRKAPPAGSVAAKEKSLPGNIPSPRGHDIWMHVKPAKQDPAPIQPAQWISRKNKMARKGAAVE